MTTPKPPAKGTLRLAAKSANAAADSTAAGKAPRFAKSGARKVAAAAARGERLRPPPAGEVDPGDPNARPRRQGADGGRPTGKPGGRPASGFRGGPRPGGEGAPARKPREGFGPARAPRASDDAAPPRARPAGSSGWAGKSEGREGREGPRSVGKPERGPRPGGFGAERQGPAAGDWGRKPAGERSFRRDTEGAGDRNERPRRPAGSEGTGSAGGGAAGSGGAYRKSFERTGGRDAGPGGERRRGDAPRPAAPRPPAAGDAAAVPDVWAQARENLAARARRQSEAPSGGETPAGRKPSRKPTPVPRNVHAEGGSPLYEANGVRVSKLLAEQGLCSRREADEYISRGWVFVNGERVSELGLRVAADAKVTLAQEARAQQTKLVTILLHKPVGFVSGQPEPGYEPAASLIGPGNQAREAGDAAFTPAMMRGLAPAGRLDIDSTGLLVLTQDGRVARLLIGEDSTVEKEYLVRVEGQLVENGLHLLQHGLSLDGKALRPAKVEWLNEDQLRFVLKEGRKRQIRRMCELVGLKVVGLKRVRIGGVRLGDLPLGEWRLLRADETF